MQQQADQGNKDAANTLGYLYDRGEGVPQDQAKAREFFQKAADAGLPKAQYNLGRFMVLGIGGPQDTEGGLNLLEKAAHGGVPTAQVTLANIYFFGEYGQKPDNDKAYAFALMAAKSGDADSQNMVGFMTQYGRGVKLNVKEASEWLRKAADQGHAKAQAALADILRYGGRGVEKDVAEAVKLYTLAAEQGEATGKVPLDEITGSLDPAILAEGTRRAEQFKQARSESNRQPPAE